MKQILVVGMALAMLGSLGHDVASGALTFTPSRSPDLWDLDHQDFYAWSIVLPAGIGPITSASITIKSINDWSVEDGDILYVHLLDDPPVSPLSDVVRGQDLEAGGDNFAGQGLLLTTFTDDDGWPNPAEDFTYDFTPADLLSLNAFAGNGLIGLGFDPDCHYYNEGVQLSIRTVANPAPGAVLLSSMGVGIVGWLRSRKRI